MHEKLYILHKNVLKQMMFQINGNIYGINTEEKKGRVQSTTITRCSLLNSYFVPYNYCIFYVFYFKLIVFITL